MKATCYARGAVRFVGAVIVVMSLSHVARGQVPAEPATPPTADVHFLMAPPGCPEDGDTNINLLTVLFDHFEGTSGAVTVGSVGASALSRGKQMLFARAPDPADSGERLPRQWLMRSSAGFVLHPAKYFKDVRMGAVVQFDFTLDHRYDAGLEASYVLELPVVGPPVYKSELSLRYFVPDARDVGTDFGVVGTWTHRFVVPFTHDLSLFVFADLFVVRGKVPETREFAASAIFGGGLDFTRVVRL